MRLVGEYHPSLPGRHANEKEFVQKASNSIVCLTKAMDQRPKNIALMKIAYALAEVLKLQHQDPVHHPLAINLVFPDSILSLLVQSWKIVKINESFEQQGLEDLIDRIRQS